MIGNEQDVDILLPKRLGMQAIFINRTGKTEPKPFKIKPDAIVSDLKEAIKIVEEWIKPDK